MVANYNVACILTKFVVCLQLALVKRIGGRDIHTSTVNVMKRIISNEVATSYSLKGKKKKKVFMDLKHINDLIVEVVQFHYKNSTETDIAKIVSSWLTQSTLRYSRER